jgi:low temperature requirement protein LtrA
MVGGIIAVAAGDEVVLSHPDAVGEVRVAWLVLGGTALFIAGHAAYKASLWRHISWPRIAAVVVLALLALLAPHVSALVLGACAAAVVVAVAAVDQATTPAAREAE